MKHTWYEDIVSTVEKCISIKTPFEIVHFPSTGVTSAINKLSQKYKESNENILLIPIDFEALLQNIDQGKNQNELFRVIKTQIEQQLGISFETTTELAEILKNHVQLKKKVFFVLETTSNLEIQKMPGFNDFLVYLDILKDYTEGAINIIITSNYPLYKNQSTAPIPLITQYFNYHNPGRLFRTFNEDIFQKKVKPEKILEIIEATNGLAALGKGIRNDLLLLDKKASEIDFNNIDGNFFEEFQSLKQYLDRIKSKLTRQTLIPLKSIILGEDISQIDPIVLDYLKKTGFIDEKYQIKGTIFKEYFKLFTEECKDDTNKAGFPNESTSKDFNSEEFYKIQNDQYIHKFTGEIYFRNKITEKCLTKNELSIIKEFYDFRKTPVSKEKIAQIVWGEDYPKRYSEWAIDKLISRLRDKLEDKKPNRIILTSRNKGYILA